jgi:hypothetical protein
LFDEKNRGSKICPFNIRLKAGAGGADPAAFNCLSMPVIFCKAVLNHFVMFTVGGDFSKFSPD